MKRSIASYELHAIEGLRDDAIYAAHRSAANRTQAMYRASKTWGRTTRETRLLLACDRITQERSRHEMEANQQYWQAVDRIMRRSGERQP